MSSSSNSLNLAGVVAFSLAAALAGYYFTSRTRSDSSGKDKKANSAEPTTLEIPTIDLNAFFSREADPKAYEAMCEKVAIAFHDYGLVILKDPRVSEADNSRFLDMVEKYFEQSDGVRDARPQYSYQVGVTGEGIERARNHCALMGAYDDNNKPLSPCPPEFDLKWRFFWRTGPQPPKTEFPLQNMDPVIPPEFPQWRDVMDMWGGKMTAALFTLAEMAAVGFKMTPDEFTSRMLYGPHLLAPTGSDFNKYDKIGSVLAGYHYDLNFMTIHGKSRFPGLYVWTREGKKMTVSIPDGCLLVQAGKQMERLTGGYVLAGFHEVVITPATKKVIDRKKAAGESLWRVSSTCFGHIQSDQILEPIAPFNNAVALAKYPPLKAGVHVDEELKAISLAAK